MNKTDDAKQARKEALKNLRESRRQTIENASRRMKAQKKVIDAIREQLQEGGRTVPELAEGTGISTSEVMWTIAALKNYGEITEGEKDGSYFRYQLVAAPAEQDQ
jgi:predicted transcriptional regulator